MNWDWHPVGGYTCQPKNVLKPLLYGAGVMVRVRAFEREPGYKGAPVLQVEAGPIGVGHRRRLRVAVIVRHGRSPDHPGLGGQAREAAVWLSGPDVGIIRRMRACLNGTGYQMGPRERVLARAAHRVGLRHDRVFAPRPT